ncbi:hypothetical protein [Salidesulfovibrio onnuriiensis]|uniref:hypothetical protein n=1 Tax=Salidesulfovibrio onnuriiensis TaxID=2583823 RepID=UPI0011CA70FE|nr:hypothetical protein [Salidesulfovibrio onnuriiensis]
MIGSITVGSILKDSLKLAWNRKWVILAFLLFSLPVLVAVVMGGAFFLGIFEPLNLSDAGSAALAVLMGLIFLFLMGAFGMCVYYNFVTALRGEPRFIPANLARKTMRSCLTMFVLAIIALLVSFAAAIPFGLIFTATLTATQSLPLIMAGGILGGIAFGFVVSAIIYRMSIVFPGIAMDETKTIGGAWDLAKGFTLKMVMVLFIIEIPSITMDIIHGYLQLTYPMNVNILLGGTIASYILYTLVGTVNFLTIVVWYEKLHVRHAERLEAKTELQPESTADEVADLI